MMLEWTWFAWFAWFGLDTVGWLALAEMMLRNDVFDCIGFS